MQVNKIIGVVTFILALLCCNYAVLYGFYHDKIRVLMKYANLSREDDIYNGTMAKAISSTRLVSATQRTTLHTTIKLDPCGRPGLIGPLRIDLEEFEREYWKVLDWNSSIPRDDTFLGNFNTVNASNHEAVYLGRRDCIPNQWVAIIIPFRDRESHLKILLGHLLPILNRQGIRYGVFVVEQIGRGVFNKGRVMNTGFKYASAASEQEGTPFDCYIFQDVDLLMENDNLLYRCSGGSYVDHLSTTIDKFKYKPLCCGMTVGGVLAFTEKQFTQVNGFPNNFWGWGAEDDAMNKRIRSKHLVVKRPKFQIGRFTMIKHEREQLNPMNNHTDDDLKLSQNSIDVNGLQDLSTKIERVEKYRFFTRIFVNVGDFG